eukprot:CAMPEP_0173387214 /NCGR_PEP_ID=MMETSP1356-20130122/9739_1 /TAXON_ID=77927 ORGANISM="Hemiselmis virescens, Strain PCC157" /NCGR_SAMPLE_ID=MMETSP1356 /ASSEMBLY_ACC=CAM_ASM_000847 /LENGTH=41 /DNA_ID= /DNA_START= /DNA_END= /DNA_ORIENTATION=
MTSKQYAKDITTHADTTNYTHTLTSQESTSILHHPDAGAQG